MMSRHISIPTQAPDDWQKLLAAPEKHWRIGYSAKALAQRIRDENPQKTRRTLIKYECQTAQ
jgi:hypothetical protein